MPPLPVWLRGPTAARQWWDGPGRDCRGSRLVAVRANRSPAFAVYRPSAMGPGHELFAIHVLELTDNRVDSIQIFVDARLAGPFGLGRWRRFGSTGSRPEDLRRRATSRRKV